MRKILILILAAVTFASCSTDDDATSDQIVGTWKLMRIEFHRWERGDLSESSIDYADKDVTYDFRQNGTLFVSGDENAGYAPGEYEYFFGEDHLGASTDPKILLVKINESKWDYNFSNGEMRLGQAYIDGPDLIFRRK